MKNNHPSGTITRIANTTTAPMKRNGAGANDTVRAARGAGGAVAVTWLTRRKPSDVEGLAPLGDHFRDAGEEPVDLHVIGAHAVVGDAARGGHVEPQRQVERARGGLRVFFRVVVVHEE